MTKRHKKSLVCAKTDIEQPLTQRNLINLAHILYGNPCLKLLREEVECLVNEKDGMGYLKQRNTKTELGKVQTEIRSLHRKLAQLEKRKAELVALLDA